MGSSSSKFIASPAAFSTHHVRSYDVIRMTCQLLENTLERRKVSETHAKLVTKKVQKLHDKLESWKAVKEQLVFLDAQDIIKLINLSNALEQQSLRHYRKAQNYDHKPAVLLPHGKLLKATHRLLERMARDHAVFHEGVKRLLKSVQPPGRPHDGGIAAAAAVSLDLRADLQETQHLEAAGSSGDEKNASPPFTAATPAAFSTSPLAAAAAAAQRRSQSEARRGASANARRKKSPPAASAMELHSLDSPFNTLTPSDLASPISRPLSAPSLGVGEASGRGNAAAAATAGCGTGLQSPRGSDDWQWQAAAVTRTVSWSGRLGTFADPAPDAGSPPGAAWGQQKQELAARVAAGDPHASRVLAAALRGGGSDVEATRLLLLRAAAAGDGHACFLLGDMAECGEGMDYPDLQQAASWYQQAAGLQDSDGMLCWAFCLDQGRGVLQDCALSLMWYEQAAQLGSTTAQNNIGKMLYDGRGLAADPATACGWFRLAADGGSVTAMNNLAICIEEQADSAEALQEALQLYSRAAELGNLSAALNADRLAAQLQRETAGIDAGWDSASEGECSSDNRYCAAYTTSIFNSVLLEGL